MKLRAASSSNLRVLQRKYNFREPESKTAFFREVAKKLLEFEPGIETE